MSNAERQRRYRERRKAELPAVHYRRPQDRRSRPQRWRDAVQMLVDLQVEYQDWLDNLPDSLHASMISGTWKPWNRRSASGAIDKVTA